MAFEVPLFSPSPFTAGADLTGGVRKFVKTNTTATQVVLAGAGEFAIGVLRNAPALGAGAQLEMAGIHIVEAGAAVAVDDWVSSDAAGLAVPNVLGTPGEFVVGKALTSAAAAGELVAVTVGIHGFRV